MVDWPKGIVESTKLSAIFLHKVSNFCISIHYL